MNILIVEDNNQLIQSVAEACREKGWTVLLANTAEQAFEVLEKTQCQVVVLDVMLAGGMNGFDILETLKRRDEWKTIPVIMLTNLDSEEQTARQIGVADFIVKANASLDDVVSRIEQAVSHSII